MTPKEPLFSFSSILSVMKWHSWQRIFLQPRFSFLKELYGSCLLLDCEMDAHATTQIELIMTSGAFSMSSTAALSETTSLKQTFSKKEAQECITKLVQEHWLVDAYVF
jgi:hypothetical protein